MLHHTLAVVDNLAVGHIVVVHILVVEVVDLAVDSLEVADLAVDNLEELLGCTLVAEGSYHLQR